MLHLLPVRLDPTTGQVYMKSNSRREEVIFLIYRILLGGLTLFVAYRTMDFIVFSATWDPILSPVTLMWGAVEGVAVAALHNALQNLDKFVKIYNGLFNLNEDKGLSGYRISMT